MKKGPADKYSAFEYGTYLLSRQDYPSKALLRKMLDKQYSRDDAEEAIERLTEMKYLDDERYVEVFVRSKAEISCWSKIKIQMKLSEKGVDRKLAELEFEKYDWDEIRLKAYVKRYGYTQPDDPKERNRRMGFLGRQGHKIEIPSQETLDTLAEEHGI